METLTDNGLRHISEKRATPHFSETGNLTSSQNDVLSEDLATFLVAHYILVAKNPSLSSIKEHFSKTPDLLEVVDHVLFQLEKAEMVSVHGDRLKLSNQIIDLGGNAANLSRFIPRLFSLGAERVLEDAQDGSHKRKREALRYFVIPNSAEFASEAKALQLEFSAKMYNLMDRARSSSSQSDGVQLIGVFQAELVSEDFV